MEIQYFEFFLIHQIALFWELCLSFLSFRCIQTFSWNFIIKFRKLNFGLWRSLLNSFKLLGFILKSSALKVKSLSWIFSLQPSAFPNLHPYNVPKVFSIIRIEPALASRKDILRKPEKNLQRKKKLSGSYSQNTENPPEKKENIFLVSFDERVSQFLDFFFSFLKKKTARKREKSVFIIYFQPQRKTHLVSVLFCVELKCT